MTHVAWRIRQHLCELCSLRSLGKRPVPADALADFSNPYASVSGGNPFPAPQPPPPTYFTTANYQSSGYSTFDPTTYKLPVTYSWNLAVEQQYTSKLSSRVAYVGSRSNHQYVPSDINPTYNQGPTIGKRVYFSPNNIQNYTQQIALVDSGGNAIYHSLQASLQNRISNGLTLFFNYTWSKAIDNFPFGASATAVVPGSGYSLPIYESNFKRLDYGPSDYDHRNVISLSYVWQFPKFKGGNAFARYVVNGWQTNGIFAFRSGNPLTVTGAGNSGTNLGRERGVWNGKNPYGGNACGRRDDGLQAVSEHCKLLDKSELYRESSTLVRQRRQRQLRWTAICRLGCQHDALLSHSRGLSIPVQSGVLQRSESH